MKLPSQARTIFLLTMLFGCQSKPEELQELEEKAEYIAEQKANIDSLRTRLRVLDSVEALEGMTPVSEPSLTGYSVPDMRSQLRLHRSICNDEEKYKNSESSWEVEVLGSSTGTIMQTDDGGVGVAIHYDPILESPDGMFILYGPGPSSWTRTQDFPPVRKGTRLVVQGRVLGNMHGETSGCVPVLEVSRARIR